jgi:hypothetical protein
MGAKRYLRGFRKIRLNQYVNFLGYMNAIREGTCDRWIEGNTEFYKPLRLQLLASTSQNPVSAKLPSGNSPHGLCNQRAPRLAL